MKTKYSGPVQAPALGVSVIVCCHNSSTRLPATLKRLAEQICPASIPWEVLVVDNASSDGTGDIARACWPADAPAPLRVILEPNPGLTHARLRGLAESRFEFLSLVDDDNWVSADWVSRVFGILSSRPEVAACGGRGEPAPETAPPAWFSAFASGYAVGPQGEAEGYVAEGRSFLYGAGLSIRKSAWSALISSGFRPVLSDRKGKSLASGGDSELCYALVLAGWKLWYDPGMCFEHFLPSGRLTWDYVRRLHRDFGAAAVFLEQYKELISPSRDIAFQHMPLLDNTCRVIRRSWLFQAYATGRTIWARFRAGRYGRRRERWTEGNPEVLHIEWERGRATHLLKSILAYDRVFLGLQRAGWRPRSLAGHSVDSTIPGKRPLPTQDRVSN